MAVVVYLYTVIAFNFFRKFYTKEEDEEKEENCKDMFTCFKFHLYSGIRAGGGIGDELESPNGDPLELYRIVFDITFFFFIIVILLAIIQGLIIDAFGDLREQLDSVKETLEVKFLTKRNKSFDHFQFSSFHRSQNVSFAALAKIILIKNRMALKYVEKFPMNSEFVFHLSIVVRCFLDAYDGRT